MSYKSLLFCPDEKTARLVTQVLKELEFTVAVSNDPSVTAQKLADEHFDALVADIANEQDAALLFKSARDSDLNHSSLSVAVVEGQAGVAKAFRIGANLVLTKPINIEQSKGTLRVARGLLRKNEAKASATPAKPVAMGRPPVSTTPIFAAPAISPSLLAQPTPVATNAPFSSLEVEQEPTPAPEPAEVALLESMTNATGTRPTSVEQTWAPTLKSGAEPIAASTASQAGAAVAPALEKPVVELRSAPPLASQEVITADSGARETFEAAAVPVPTFSYGQTSGGGVKKFKTFAMLVLVAVAAYTAWQRLQLGQYLPNLKGTNRSAEAEPVKPVENSPAATPSAAPNNRAASPDLIFPDSTPAASDDSTPPPVSPRSTERNSPSETIQVDELASGPEPKVTVTPKPQPLVVNTKSGVIAQPKSLQPAPPALAIAPSNASSEALTNIVTSAIPQPTLQVLRVSQGVSQGLLIKKVAPMYPQAALQTHKQGSVELIATVAKDGGISGIRVLSGDAVLAKAATDAVRQWKYRPYLLNGEPVQIETQITVSFKVPH
jgi:periplasmic protein TonB